MSSADELFGPVAAKSDGSEILAALRATARERILFLDGAMGTQIQGVRGLGSGGDCPGAVTLILA